MRFRHAVLLAALVITPGCAKRIKVSDKRGIVDSTLSAVDGVECGGSGGSGSVDGVVMMTKSVTTAAAVAAMVVAEATATASVIMGAAAMAGVKRQQSTSDGSVKSGQWTRARQRVTRNNENVWPMIRAATKRADDEDIVLLSSHVVTPSCPLAVAFRGVIYKINSDY